MCRLDCRTVSRDSFLIEEILETAMILREIGAYAFTFQLMLIPLCTLRSQEATEAGRASINQLLDKSVLSFRVVPKGSEQLTLNCLPVLRWTNDVRDSHSVGLLSLWVDRGRPTRLTSTF